MTDWSRIVQEHGPAVWSTVYRLIDHDADAADCFQDVFISALEVSRKETVRSWPALLKRLAISRSLDWLRRRYRMSDRMTVPLESPTIDDRTVARSGTADGRELAEEIRRALAELDARQARVFCLACVDGLAYAEIADQLCITVNHVGVLLNRARSNLRERLQDFRPDTTAKPPNQEVPS